MLTEVLYHSGWDVKVKGESTDFLRGDVIYG
jgi:hypothetical protein